VYNMVDVSEITVQVDLPERYYGAVAMGSSVDIIVSGRTEEVYTGTVSGIARSASAETHTFPIIVKVPNKNGELGGGKLVRARLSLDTRFTSLAVHKDALVRNGDQTLVYTIADDKAVPISVVAGSTQGEFIAVSSDQLTVGMAIVVRGNERIFPGAPVRIQDTASQEGQNALTQQAAAKSTN
jgi:multidrug efflux pump subunit AcrA (membrane-fusion protein)